MSHLVTHITDQKEAWQQSHGLLELAMLFFATPPLTINAIYDLSVYGGHHHADSRQLLKGTQSSRFPCCVLLALSWNTRINQINKSSKTINKSTIENPSTGKLSNRAINCKYGQMIFVRELFDKDEFSGRRLPEHHPR